MEDSSLGHYIIVAVEQQMVRQVAAGNLLCRLAVQKPPNLCFFPSTADDTLGRLVHGKYESLKRLPLYSNLP